MSDGAFLIYLKGRKADPIAQSDEVATSYLLQADQPFGILAHSVIESVAGVHFLLEVVGELLGHFRIATGELLVAVFGVDVFCNRDRRLLGVEDKRSLSFGGESRVVTEQSPVTGIHGHLLVLKLAVEIETVVDAGAVADDQRRTIVCFCFLENLQGLSIVCAEGNATDVNVLVAHGDEAEVLLASTLTSGSEEGDCATVRGLGSLSTSVGVHFGIEDADVHVFARGPMMTVRARLRRNTLVGAHSHLKVAMPTKATQLPSGQRSPTAHSVVETTVTDVVCPTVTV